MICFRLAEKHGRADVGLLFVNSSSITDLNIRVTFAIECFTGITPYWINTAYKKCPYSKISWFAFSPTWTEDGDLLRKSPYSSECGKIRTSKTRALERLKILKIRNTDVFTWWWTDLIVVADILSNHEADEWGRFWANNHKIFV